MKIPASKLALAACFALGSAVQLTASDHGSGLKPSRGADAPLTPLLSQAAQDGRLAAAMLRQADDAARRGDLLNACKLLNRATGLSNCDPSDATEVMAKIYIRGGDFDTARGLLERYAPLASPRQRDRFADLEQLCAALAALEKGHWDQAKAGTANVRCPETRASLSRLVSNVSLIFPQEDLYEGQDRESLTR